MRTSNCMCLCEWPRLSGLALWSWPQGPVPWKPTTAKWRQFSLSNRHPTIGTRQTENHEALPSSANVQSHLTSSFADDGNASWYSVCRVLMVEWWLDCENCRHLTVVGLHDTGPASLQLWKTSMYNVYYWSWSVELMETRVFKHHLFFSLKCQCALTFVVGKVISLNLLRSIVCPRSRAAGVTRYISGKQPNPVKNRNNLKEIRCFLK